MRKILLAFAGLALIAPSFAAPASAQSGGWPVDQDAPEYVADEGDYDKDQPPEFEYVDPDTAYYQDQQPEPRRYRPGDTYRGDGQPYRGDDGRLYCRRSDGTTGAIVGGAGGALIGRGIDTRGRRATGTILGALAGALIGSAIERGQRCR